MTKIIKPRMVLTDEDKQDYRAAIDAAVETKKRLHKGMYRVQALAEEPERFAAVRKRILGKGGLIHQYAQEIEAVKAALPEDGLIELSFQLEERLERGFGIDGEKADELFEKLLTELEVVVDALEGAARTRMLDRIAAWESYVND